MGEVKGAPEKILASHQSTEQHQEFLEELEVVHQFPEAHMKAPESLHQSPEEIEVLPQRIPENIVTVQKVYQEIEVIRQLITEEVKETPEKMITTLHQGPP